MLGHPLQYYGGRLHGIKRELTAVVVLGVYVNISHWIMKDVVWIIVDNGGVFCSLDAENSD